VTLVSNGRAAVEAVEQEQFDVVLMDIQMPEMGGLEATEAIRAWEASTGGHVRIVAMTAHALMGDRERCLAAGMDHYLAKPVDRQQLFDAVEQGHGVRAASAEPVERAAGDAVARDAFDIDATMNRVSGDVDLLRELGHLFLDLSPRHLDRMRAAIDAGDHERLAAEAHGMRGSAGALGADRVVAAVRTLERMANERQFETARAQVGHVSAAVDDFARSLRGFLATVSA
jgi:protein-histidine pros-kinase